MKNSEVSSLEIDVKIRKVVLRFLKHREDQVPQKASLCSDLASLSKLPVGFEVLSRRYKDLLTFLVLLHYFPMERSIYCYFYLDLQDTLSETESFWLSVLVEDKDLFLRYLEVQETITEQSFFSGIVNESNLAKVLSLVVFRFEEKLQKPRRVIRRKGYRDKGSLGSESSRVIRKEEKSDFYLTLRQFELEEHSLIRSTECQLLREYLTGLRVLTDELMIKFRLKKGDLNELRRKSDCQTYIEQRETGTINSKEGKNRERN